MSPARAGASVPDGLEPVAFLAGAAAAALSVAPVSAVRDLPPVTSPMVRCAARTRAEAERRLHIAFWSKKRSCTPRADQGDQCLADTRSLPRMLSGVLRMRRHFEVGPAVVRLVAVAMVNHFPRSKPPPESVFRNHSVQKDCPPSRSRMFWKRHHHVALRCPVGFPALQLPHNREA